MSEYKELIGWCLCGLAVIGIAIGIVYLGKEALKAFNSILNDRYW